MIDLPNITNMDYHMRELIGVSNWSDLSSASTKSSKVEILINYLVETYSFFFEKESTMDSLAGDISILSSIDDENFELSPELVNSIMDINQIVEIEDVDDEIKQGIKSILVYILDILKSS